MITRRTLLASTAGLTLSSLLTSCGANAVSPLKVTLLEGSVPVEVLKRFRKQTDGHIAFETFTQLNTIFRQLQTLQEKSEKPGFSFRQLLPWARTEQESPPDSLVSLGDYWLTSAIAQNLLDPIELSPEALNKLPEVWQTFVSRDDTGHIQTNAPTETPSTENTASSEESSSSSKTSLWAAPYKIQSLVIVYRQSQFPEATVDNPPFKAWGDLLQPKLSQKLALPNHPRIVLGLLQKIQGSSFNLSFAPNTNADTNADNNSPDINTNSTPSPVTEQLTEQLAKQLTAPFGQLNQQVRTYDSQNALKALINKDVDAVVAWSGDVVGTLQRYRDLKVVVPEEGSLLSADMWVRPKGAPMGEAAQAWIDFCWQTEAATQISLSGKGLSPVFLKVETDGESLPLPETLNSSILPIAAMKNSEPLLPLPPEQESVYLELWQKLRSQ